MRQLVLTLCCVMLAATFASAQGIDTTTADLPPDGVYVSPNEYHQYSAAGIILDDPSHRPLVGTTIRTPVGNDEIETFDSVFTAVEIGLGLGPIQLTGPTSVLTRDRMLSTSGLFDAEIVSMSLSGNVPGLGPIMVREDPTRASTGQTDIIDLGGGLYHIDSFFDVFTELSPDGGQTWIPSDSSTRMTLIPEPATLTMLPLGAAALRKRRRMR